MKFIQILNEIVNHPFPTKKRVVIKNTDNNEISVDCEHAKSEEEKMTGVLGMENMGENNGILFSDISPTYYHMNGVKFPLDMIFCDGEGTILDVVTAEPDGDNIYPPNGSQFNLEVNGGFCDKNNINKGDVVYMS